MDIAGFFSDLAEHFTHHPVRRHRKATVQMDSKLHDVIKVIETQRFKYVGTEVAAKALQDYKKARGEELGGSGIDLFKKRDNGDLNVIGIVCSGKDGKHDLVVQLDILAADGSLTLPKTMPLGDFLRRVPGHKIEDIFDKIPAPPPANAEASRQHMRQKTGKPLKLAS